MDFSYIFLFLLACIGMCHIIVDGSILQWFRNSVHWFSAKTGWKWPVDLISCYLCVGTWTGFFLGLIMQPFGDKLNIFIQAIVSGFASSYMSMAGAALLNYLDRPWGEASK